MSNQVLHSPISLPADTSVTGARQADRFFLGMSIVLLAILLIGFSRTLFLRPLFQVPAIPWYDYVHGAVMTMWFVLLVVQTSLVAAHRADLHRRLGIFGAALAIAVVTLGLTLTLQLPAHLRASGGELTTGLPASPASARGFLWGDIEAIALFSTFVATALIMRRRSDTHKRLMLLASIAMITPAVGTSHHFSGPFWHYLLCTCSRIHSQDPSSGSHRVAAADAGGLRPADCTSAASSDHLGSPYQFGAGIRIHRHRTGDGRRTCPLACLGIAPACIGTDGNRYASCAARDIEQANHSPHCRQLGVRKMAQSDTIRAPQPPHLLSTSSSPRARAVTRNTVCSKLMPCDGISCL